MSQNIVGVTKSVIYTHPLPKNQITYQSLMRTVFLTLSIIVIFSLQAVAALVYKGQVKDSVDGVDGLWGAQCVTVSPDGRNVYAAGSWDNALSWFSRDSASGGLTYGGLLTDGRG
jgi:DNA-binding beta-propeller fold protein YncE